MQIPLSQAELNKIYTVTSVGWRGRQRLLCLGIYPGSQVILSQRKPSHIVRAGETEVALDREIASEILVLKDRF